MDPNEVMRNRHRNPETLTDKELHDVWFHALICLQCGTDTNSSQTIMQKAAEEMRERARRNR